MSKFSVSLKKIPSPFDYSLVLSRKHRYLVIASEELGCRVACADLAAGEPSPEAIGQTVLRIIRQMDARLHELRLRGERPPRPLRSLK